MFRVCTILFVALLLPTFLAVSALGTKTRADAAQTLRFVDDGPLSLSISKSNDIEDKVVTIHNEGPEGGTLQFSARLGDSTNTIVPDALSITAVPATLERAGVESFKLSFTPSPEYRKKVRDLSGHLVVVVERHPNIAPGTRPLKVSTVRTSEIDPFVEPVANPGRLLTTLGVVALGFVFLRWILRGREARQTKLHYYLGSATWKFSESWASSLTAIGAVLGSVISANLLVSDPELLRKSEYIALNVLFLTLIVGATALYNGTRMLKLPAKKEKAEPYYHGWVWSYLASSAIIFGAVLGELLVTVMFLAEIDRQNTVSSSVITCFVVLVAILMLVAATYMWRTTRDTLVNEAKDPNAEPPESPDGGRRQKGEVVVRMAKADGTMTDLDLGDLLGDLDVALPVRAEPPRPWTLP